MSTHEDIVPNLNDEAWTYDNPPSKVRTNLTHQGSLPNALTRPLIKRHPCLISIPSDTGTEETEGVHEREDD